MKINGDTNQKARGVLLNLLRTMTPAQRLSQALSMSRACAAFSLAGIHSRNPQLSEAGQLREFARLHLGAALADKAYRYRDTL
jgi:hypothetical protein